MDSFEITRRRWIAAVGASAGALIAGGPSRAQAPVKPGARQLHPTKIPVAIVVDDYTNLMDTACVWEPFLSASKGSTPKEQLFQVYLVAPEAKQYHTSGNRPGPNGLVFTPNYTFADAPQPKILIVPSQMHGGAAKREWIRKVEPAAEVVMPVCLGGSTLATTGLLDGRSAATHHAYIADLQAAFPKVKWVAGQRVVEDGKYISGAGYTSALDAALYVIARYHGADVAQATADWLEYAGEGWKNGLRV